MMCIAKFDMSMDQSKINRRGGIYSASSSKNYVQRKDGDCQPTTCSTNNSANNNADNCEQSQSCTRLIRRRNGIILSAPKTKQAAQSIEEDDKLNIESSKGNPSVDQITGIQEMMTHDQRQKQSQEQICTVITKNHVIIDRDSGFDNSHEGNRLFLDILHTYYSEMYTDVSSSITHRRLVLNIVLDDMYSRGFKFIWKENGIYFKIHDETVILKKIREKLKQTII